MRDKQREECWAYEVEPLVEGKQNRGIRAKRTRRGSKERRKRV